MCLKMRLRMKIHEEQMVLGGGAGLIPVQTCFLAVWRIPASFYHYYLINGKSPGKNFRNVKYHRNESKIHANLCASPAPCDAGAFFCHSNMCINNTLVCNGVQNCVYPWDENQCKGEVTYRVREVIWMHHVGSFALACSLSPFFSL